MAGMDSDAALRRSVAAALRSFQPLEGKVEGKVCTYFSKSGRNLDVQRRWEDILTQYADNCFSKLFASGFAKEDWFYRVDWLRIFRVGFEGIVPPRRLQHVRWDVLDSAISDEYDQAFEKHRAPWLFWQLIERFLQDE